MGLEPVHLCSSSSLGLLLAGLAQNDVRVEGMCWVFVMVGELTG